MIGRKSRNFGSFSFTENKANLSEVVLEHMSSSRCELRSVRQRLTPGRSYTFQRAQRCRLWVQQKNLSPSSCFRSLYERFLSHSWLRSFAHILAPRSLGAKIELFVSFLENLVFPAVEEDQNVKCAKSGPNPLRFRKVMIKRSFQLFSLMK